MLRELIRSEHVKNAIIFCNRKRDVAILLKSLLKHGFNAGALHGDMDQMSRTATLDAFREGRITLLAASDVAARGLDIPDVSHIFNFDVPWQSDDYVHRIGRTGRAGKEGRSLTLVTPDDVKQLKDIEKMLGAPITWIGDAPSADDIASGPSAVAAVAADAAAGRPRCAPSRAAAQRRPVPQRSASATRAQRRGDEAAPAGARGRTGCTQRSEQPQPALSRAPSSRRRSARIAIAASTTLSGIGKPGRPRPHGRPRAHGGAAPSARGDRRPQRGDRPARPEDARRQARRSSFAGQAGPPALGAASATCPTATGRSHTVTGRPRRSRAGLPEEDHAHATERERLVSSRNCASASISGTQCAKLVAVLRAGSPARPTGMTGASCVLSLRA